MIFKNLNQQTSPPYSISGIRCPGCGCIGIFTPVGIQDISIEQNGRAGIRKCPGPNCNTILFFVSKDSSIVYSAPALRIDFDKSGVPTSVIEAFDEVLTCHAMQCPMAAGIMIRKTLELICEDKGAKGKDLKERISSLKSMLILPSDLLAGLDDLRLLGNDAAHVESKTFESVGIEEIEISIALTKEILKGIYSYSTLRARMIALKKGNP